MGCESSYQKYMNLIIKESNYIINSETVEKINMKTGCKLIM